MPAHMRRGRGRPKLFDRKAAKDARKAMGRVPNEPKHMREGEGRPWWAAFIR